MLTFQQLLGNGDSCDLQQYVKMNVPLSFYRFGGKYEKNSLTPWCGVNQLEVISFKMPAGLVFASDSFTSSAK
jgi:hypothetical protein